MKELYYGYYATGVYLPLSTLSRRWRLWSHRLKGKTDRFLQPTRLPEVSWRRYSTAGTPRVWEPTKENGNVRISELGILSALAAACEAGTNLFEIGTFDGRTTLNLAMNAPDSCHIYTLDLPPDQATEYPLAAGEHHMVEKAKPGARYAQYGETHPTCISRIHQLYGDSAAFGYSPFAGSCSLVFVDGSHAYEYARADTQTAMRIVRKGGIVVWHDYGVWEGVTRALEECERRERYGLRHIRGTSLVLWENR